MILMMGTMSSTLMKKTTSNLRKATTMKKIAKVKQFGRLGVAEEDQEKRVRLEPLVPP